MKINSYLKSLYYLTAAIRLNKIIQYQHNQMLKLPILADSVML